MGSSSAFDLGASLSDHGNILYVVNYAQLEDLKPDSTYTLIIPNVVTQVSRRAILSKLSRMDMNIVLIMEKEYHEEQEQRSNEVDLNNSSEQINAEIALKRRKIATIQDDVDLIEKYLKTKYGTYNTSLPHHLSSVEKQLNHSKEEVTMLEYYLQETKEVAPLLPAVHNIDPIQYHQDACIPLKRRLWFGTAPLIG